MENYIDEKKSIYNDNKADVKDTLTTISNHFISQNPEKPYTIRPYCMTGIMRDEEYRYDADFNLFFPESEPEQYVYGWGCYTTESPVTHKFDITPYGPMAVFCNGSQIYKTDIFVERYKDSRVSIELPFHKGINHLVIRFKKTRAGFGGIFGTWLGKLSYYFTFPGKHHQIEGFRFSEPVSEIQLSLEKTNSISHSADLEEMTHLKWYPHLDYSKEHLLQSPFERIFSVSKGRRAIAKSAINLDGNINGKYELKGWSENSYWIYLDNQLLTSGEQGSIEYCFTADPGKKDVLLVTESGEKRWNCRISIYENNREIPFSNPWLESESKYSWLYTGPFDKNEQIDPEKFNNSDNLIETSNGLEYWFLDFPGGRARIYNDNPLFGHWNYPLGVTLFGLLRSAESLNSPAQKQYVSNHIQKSINTFNYAQWDKKTFGGATSVHHLLTSLDSLDDCGSFGATLLAAAEYDNLSNYREIADFVADYICNKQIRLEDGTFFRKNLMHTFHEDTLWADDLYMSIPFLSRYGILTGDQKYLDDAAQQFMGFKKHLYIPEKQIMSHVYDFKRNMANGVPWGRGNGWVLFSLSELLSRLPSDHNKRSELIQFFLTLSEGYLKLQDSEGMWHQVLDDHSSYPETSCTAMFIYSFSRAIQMRLFSDPEPYYTACHLAWQALTRTSIDKDGNVYGVCRGSEFSFSPEYYKEELLSKLNDTHGIGIVLLAGSELLSLDNIPE